MSDPADPNRELLETDGLLPTGVDHLLLSFADPFTVRSWSGLEVDGVPDLAAQLRLFRDEVIPALT